MLEGWRRLASCLGVLPVTHKLCAGSWGRGAHAAAGVRAGMRQGLPPALMAQQVCRLRQRHTSTVTVPSGFISSQNQTQRALLSGVPECAMFVVFPTGAAVAESHCIRESGRLPTSLLRRPCNTQPCSVFTWRVSRAWQHHSGCWHRHQHMQPASQEARAPFNTCSAPNLCRLDPGALATVTVCWAAAAGW
jgi:hypothetical protein